MSIVANVGVLAIFKYYNFFIDNLNELFFIFKSGAHLPLLNILLPIGLSFHTFQAMSYTIEVYRGNQKAERHLGIYALYVMFYPQLVAGPIERPQNLLYQFRTHHTFDYDRVVSGLKLMMWGMLKKVVIADRLALFSNPYFDHPRGNSGVALGLAALFFSFQIYCDFSGYSDIAIGAARVMGFKLMTNFNSPYHSRSISEFWKRWHISLSTWFKDYLYISMGGNRVSVPRMYFNLFFVFLVSGFWHGANWTFIIWGALHGFYLIFALVTRKMRDSFITSAGIKKIHWLNNGINVITTFVLVALAWVFFRAQNVSDAFYIIRKIMTIPLEIKRVVVSHKVNFLHLPGIVNVILPCFLVIILLELAHVLEARYKLTLAFLKQPLAIRWLTYYLYVFVIVYFGVFEKIKFIYFQF